VQAGILERVAAGTPGAVQECIDRYAGLVWSLARRFCASPSDAEDAVQEIFLDVWRSSKRFDPAVAAEATFIAMIARRRLIDRSRRTKRSTASLDSGDMGLSLGDDQPQPLATAELGEDARRAALALDSLKPEQQRVLRLSIYQGLSHEKIAESTGLPLGTVKTHVRRGLIRLREILGEPGAESSPGSGEVDS
jgi:RNA polymerase sigma-70 factor (ECF subfamily)